MSQIRAKQIKLVNEGDLVVGNGLGNGSILSAGDVGQVLHVAGSALQWDWLQSLYDPNGVLVLDSGISTGGVNYYSITAGITSEGPKLEAIGPDTNIDVNLVPKGLGEILAPVGYTDNIFSPNALITKQYVDSSVAGLDWKNSVKVATTSNTDLAGYTYDSGAEPQGAVWTGVTTAPTIDGVTLLDGDRILIKNDTDNSGVGNGLFTYDATQQAFVRSGDADNTPNNEVSDGLAVFVETGTTNAGTAWVITSPNGEATLGADELVFTQFAGTNLYTAGAGLTLAGNQFSVNSSTTVGFDLSNNVIVRSNNVAGQVLLSTGTTGVEAAWGALNLNNSNAVTGLLNVTNGGTGLTSIPSGHIVVGNTASAVTTLAPTPATTADTVFVLQTNSSGDNVQYGGLTLNQLSNVTVPTPAADDVLQWNGTAWVNVPIAATDKLVRITANDTTSGYLDGKVVVPATGALTKTVVNPGADEDLQLEVNYDAATIIINGSNELAVGGGLNNQVLKGVTGDVATWGYQTALYTPAGVETVTVTTSGNVIINGTEFPTSVPANSILVANEANTLSALSTGGSVNTIMIYDAVASSFAFIPVTEVGGNDWGAFVLAGNVTGDATITAASTNDTIEVSAGVGISLGGADATSEISIEFGRFGMPATTAVLADTFPFFDGTNADKPAYTTFSAAFTSMGVPSNVTTSTGILTQVSAGEWVGRTIVASTAIDEVGIVITNGDGVAGNPTVGLDITGLTASTEVDPAADYFVMFDTSTSTNVKVTVDDMLTDAGLGTPAWASANATTGANLTLTGFFANTPVTDDTITVYFNGLALKKDGWTRTGNNLTLVDGVNGYGAEAGDVLTAAYEY